MALIVNLVPLLFSAALVSSDQSKVPLKSFKINENVIYDCIDIYKQPGLDHPLLRNHKIQMKPSFSPHDSTNQTGNNATYKTKIACPYGTVPILRNTKEFNTNAQIFAEKYLNPILADGLDPLTHIAGVRSEPGPYRGVQAFFNAYNLDLRDDEASYNQIYIGSGLNNEANFVMTGLMGKDGKGCYNTGCPGFVQLSPRNPIAFPLGMKPLEAGNIHPFIHQDKQTGNWWLSTLGYNLFKVDIGYWPKELFNLMDNGGNIVGAGGVVHASPFGSSPAMGHGQFPKQPVPSDGSPTFSDVKVMNSKYESHRMDYFPIEKLLDSPQCYGIEIGINEPPHHDHRGFFFDVGGPGGNTWSGKDDNATKSKKTRKVQFDPQGGKGSKGRKSALSKESQPLELKTDKELPENAKCLMDCEAFEILQGIKEQMAVLSEDPSMCVIANVCPESIDEVFAFLPSMKKAPAYAVSDKLVAESHLSKHEDIWWWQLLVGYVFLFGSGSQKHDHD
ncbi:hypothetical protein Bca4012_051909 [Brassica carinata]